MSETQHTPGPWRTGLPRWIDDAKGRPIACAFSRKKWSTIDEAEANGRLIAQAPRLLAALKAIVGAHTAHNASTAAIIGRDMELPESILESARAAIAAAEGKEGA